MPIFLDSHHGVDLPVEVIRTFVQRARTHAPDAHGVTPLDLYCGEDGRVFLVVAAPDEATVRQRHAAEGVICRRVRRVQSLSALEELGAEEAAVIREVIASEQHAAWMETDSLRHVG